MNLIFFCTPDVCKNLDASRVSFLGHAQSGQWGEMSVDNATAVMQQCPDVKILYLNKTDFLSAMDQLSDRETEDAVLYRLQRWSPNLRRDCLVDT